MAPFNAADLAPTFGKLVVNGETVALMEGANVLDVLREETRRRGITTFAAFVDGQELNSLNDISEHIEDGHTVEVRTYAKPGVGRLSL